MLKNTCGETQYEALIALSHRARKHLEAEHEDSVNHLSEALKIFLEMEQVLLRYESA